MRGGSLSSSPWGSFEWGGIGEGGERGERDWCDGDSVLNQLMLLTFLTILIICLQIPFATFVRRRKRRIALAVFTAFFWGVISICIK